MASALYSREERIRRLQEIIDLARSVEVSSLCGYKYLNTAMDAMKVLNEMADDGLPPHEYRKLSSLPGFNRNKLTLKGKTPTEQIATIMEAVDAGDLSQVEITQFLAVFSNALKSQELTELKPMLQEALDKLSNYEKRNT